MKLILDTNIYISWIREGKYPEIMLDVRTQKYLACHVLMELWAGARTKQAAKIIEKLQKPYQKADRIVELSGQHYIKAGQLIAALPENISDKRKNAGFINDIHIALSAASIGAMLFTENKADFEIIGKFLPELKMRALS
jgi:predicted nucleic acid-binding protein